MLSAHVENIYNLYSAEAHLWLDSIDIFSKLFCEEQLLSYITVIYDMIYSMNCSGRTVIELYNRYL